jgi:hypothetical protein
MKANPPHVNGRPDPARRSLMQALAATLPLALGGCGGTEEASAAATPLGPSAATDGGSVTVATPSGTPSGTATAGGAAATPPSVSTPAGAPPPPASSTTTAGAGVPPWDGKLTGKVISANPSNYLSLLAALKPGDTLLLQPGTYDNPADPPGLPIFDLNGTPAAPITVTGPAAGPRPLFIGRSTHNTIRLRNASHVIVRNVEVDGRDLGGFGVAQQGQNHHITIEGLVIRGCGGDQQNVGISTTGYVTWNWTIRRNTILGAGTGMYLGNSDGTSQFVAGLVEGNVVLDTIGYNVQIKHQKSRPNLPGMPTGPSTTVIRHNVFAKSSNSSTGDLARPNLLVGHFPTSGPGSEDLYEIYGNFLYQNPSEALFQGEGNVAFYANVMVNDSGSAVVIQPHYDVPKAITVFGNTIVARTAGVSIRGGAPGFVQRVIGNAVYAATPITGGQQTENITGTQAAAGEALVNPVGPIGQLDLYPKVGALRRSALDPGPLSALLDHDRDFNGTSRGWEFRGAYAGEGVNPGWRLALTAKG